MPISSRPPGVPAGQPTLSPPLLPSSSSSSAEYYITCFRCINSFRDGSVHRRSGPYNRGLVETAADRIGFFRRDVVNKTSSAIYVPPPRTARGVFGPRSSYLLHCPPTTSSRHYQLPAVPSSPPRSPRSPVDVICARASRRAVDLSNAQGRAPSGRDDAVLQLRASTAEVESSCGR